MGIFNKINERSGLIGFVIAAAVLLFILGDLLGGKGANIFSNNNSVGKIAGQNIPVQEYSKLVDQVKQNMGGNVSDYQLPQIHNQAWSYLILKYAYPKQYEKLGLTVSEEELEELVSGQNLWEGFNGIPNFQDPNTRQFDRKLYDQWKKNMEGQPQGQDFLENLKQEQILPDRLRSKYLALIQNGTYVTKEEAQREYKAQNTKAEVNYLYVPYYSIPDSAVKATEDEMEDYISKHKDDFKREARASIEYVMFQVKSSPEDSAVVADQLADLKKELETTTDDSAFAVANSDNGAGPLINGLGELPETLKSQAASLEKGKVYGPVSDGAKLKLYKILDIIQDPKDSMYYASTKHILFMTRGKSDAEKDSIRRKAQSVLNELKAGASFEEAVVKYSEDPGSKNNGGEYKYFPKGQMVKPFENAVFNAKTTGLVGNIVETEYGFHLLKVTQLKSNKKFKVVAIEKEIVPAEGREKAYQAALNFASTPKDTAEFTAAAKRDSLQIQKYDNLTSESSYVNSLTNPRELIQWALTKGDVNDISPVFTVGDQFIVAALLNKRDKGTAEVAEVENEVKQKVLNEKKAELIIEKLSKTNGTLQKKVEAYGAGATTGTATDVTLAAGTMQGVGQEPTIVGTVFGLIAGKRTNPIKGDNGVAILELVKISEAAQIADYTTYKNTLLSTRKQNVPADIDTAIKEDADITDNRVKFF